MCGKHGKDTDTYTVKEEVWLTHLMCKQRNDDGDHDVDDDGDDDGDDGESTKGTLTVTWGAEQ